VTLAFVVMAEFYVGSGMAGTIAEALRAVAGRGAALSVPLFAATGGFLTVLPLTMLQHRSNKTWLRALDIDLRDSASPIAAITLKKRQSGGAVQLFRQASLEVCKETIGTR